jgi:arsenate reductase (glutaredoxin)
MNTYTIYHNPRCSKSRQTLALLQEHGINPTIVDYIKSPLNIEEIELLSKHFELVDFVRTSEPVFKTLGLSLDNKQKVLEAMASEPKLMQRPIVTFKDKAVIGRPPEQALALIEA